MATPSNFEPLLSQFESLGENCEFGLFQRLLGCEPFGLFRFGYATVDSLISALDRKLENIADIDKIHIEINEIHEYMVKVTHYGLLYHSNRYVSEIGIETLRESEKIKLAFLSKRLLGALKSGKKIFVRKETETPKPDHALRLSAALQKYGKATLLWVTNATADHPSGSVERIGPQLLYGYMDRFAPQENVHGLNVSHWLDICYAAYALAAPPGSPKIRPPALGKRPANLLGTISGRPQHKIIPEVYNIVTDEDAAAYPWYADSAKTIFRHKLLETGHSFLGFRISRLVPGATYTTSLWIKFASDNQLGFATILTVENFFVRSRRADPMLHDVWQRTEAAALAAEDGTMYVRLHINAAVPITFETMNWRFEQGLLVRPDDDIGADEAFAETSTAMTL